MRLSLRNLGCLLVRPKMSLYRRAQGLLFMGKLLKLRVLSCKQFPVEHVCVASSGGGNRGL